MSFRDENDENDVTLSKVFPKLSPSVAPQPCQMDPSPKTTSQDFSR